MLLPPSAATSARHGSIEQVDPSRPDHGDVRFDGIEYAFARRMALSISAGNGLEAVDDGEAEGLAFPVSWLRRQGINADLAVLVSVKGDSMAPAIPDGALVLIHVAERSIASTGVYAFNLDGQSFVKRLVPQSTEADGRPGAVAIMSDNHSYPPLFLSGKDLNRITVVGRVRAVVAEI
ncbi:peptidase S24-like protein [Defluviimonas denitrificans]|jgi:phage repressor protein C with HTH and peptisase S24 domain|uniref:Peptidase S24-like protein n=1 Tax=Albidovulum denitrificans TaxID=404881 RepID=A0A2S8S6E9_9RHOB|nr:S24 family peptidase [Defluviimonas denitrificans]PQV56365.1 peptidase S24-like protein [Defluviimonas denitrificans]